MWSGSALGESQPNSRASLCTGTYRVTMVVSDRIALTLFFEVPQCCPISAQFAAAQAESGRQWNSQIVVDKYVLLTAMVTLYITSTGCRLPPRSHVPTAKNSALVKVFLSWFSFFSPGLECGVTFTSGFFEAEVTKENCIDRRLSPLRLMAAAIEKAEVTVKFNHKINPFLN